MLDDIKKLTGKSPVYIHFHFPLLSCAQVQRPQSRGRDVAPRKRIGKIGRKVDKDEASRVHLEMNLKETIAAHIQDVRSVCRETRRFAQTTRRVVRPAMVFAKQLEGSAPGLADDSVCAVPAYVVESAQLLVLALDYHKGDLCNGKGSIVAWSSPLGLVSNHQPALQSNNAHSH